MVEDATAQLEKRRPGPLRAHVLKRVRLERQDLGGLLRGEQLRPAAAGHGDLLSWNCGRIQEIWASGHVVLSGAETTRLLDRPEVSAAAHVLPLGEGTPYVLLHPAAPARSFIAHAPMPEDNLGYFAVAGARIASVHGDEGVADELLVPGAPGPARPHAHEIGIRCQRRCCLLELGEAGIWNVSRTGA